MIIRRNLIVLTCGAVFTALLVAAIPFVVSLHPSERAKANLPFVHIPALSVRDFAYVAHPLFPDVDLLFLKNDDGVLHIWWVPKSEGKHIIPDMHWWLVAAPCGELFPNFMKNELRCNDIQAGWFGENFRWSLEGKALYPGLDDMVKVEGWEEAGNFIIKGLKYE